MELTTDHPPYFRSYQLPRKTIMLDAVPTPNTMTQNRSHVSEWASFVGERVPQEYEEGDASGRRAE
ncbi:hypothetical protein GCM10028857_29670 [Salinarchaeum chitinilyticum]